MLSPSKMTSDLGIASLLLWVARVGRVGGAVLLLLGLGLLAFCYVDYQETGGFFVAVAIFGVVFGLLGSVILLFGNPGASAPVEPVHVQPKASFLVQVKQQTFPFRICTKHHAIIDPPQAGPSPCGDCNPVLDHLDIGDASDLQLAMAALE